MLLKLLELDQKLLVVKVVVEELTLLKQVEHCLIKLKSLLKVLKN